jgi:hypothetical protein
VAKSKSELKKMLQDLLEAVSKVGLEIHAGKTKVFQNCSAIKSKQSLQVGEHSFDILSTDSGTSYLGRFLSFGRLHDDEIESRMKTAWRKFHAHKTELCNRRFRLGHRLKLVQSIITSTALYSAGTWTMTADRERLLRTTQRKMLRQMTKIGRKVAENHDSSSSETGSENSEQDLGTECLEPWIDWIKRATDISEQIARKYGICDWTEEQRRRQWRLAGHMARRKDNRWATKLLHWNPTNGYRSRGHPAKRWSDELVKFHKSIYDRFCKLSLHMDEDWRQTAQHQQTWALLMEDFVGKCSI